MKQVALLISCTPLKQIVWGYLMLIEPGSISAKDLRILIIECDLLSDCLGEAIVQGSFEVS